MGFRALVIHSWAIRIEYLLILVSHRQRSKFVSGVKSLFCELFLYLKDSLRQPVKPDERIH